MRMTVLALALVACGAPPPPAPQPAPVAAAPAPAPAAAPAPAPAALPATPVTKNQPPDVKLKLGHYTGGRHRVGVVIDLTRARQARVQFDNTTKIWDLDQINQNGERTDYGPNVNTVMLQVWDDGRIVVWIPKTSTSVGVYRDADSDPL